jgi:hypothetical protein
MLVLLLTTVNALATSMTLQMMESALEAKLAGTELKNHQYASPTHEANKLPKMELDEAMMKVKSLPSAVTDAMKMTTLHHHKRHRHHSVDNSQFLQQQEEMKKKGIEEALDKAKLTLSNMMEETEEELDKAIITCKAFDAQTTASLDENRGFRAELAAMVAEAKSNIAKAKMMISQATTELDTLKTISEEHAYQCSITIAAKQDALRILEEDLAVSMKVENMTDCDDVAPGSTTTLMQCGTGYASRFKFAGEAARYDGFTQFKTKEGLVAVQRAAKMIAKVDLGADSYGNEHVVPSRTITRKGVVRHYRSLPVKTKNGLVQLKVQSTPPPEEVNRSSPLSAEGAEALVNMTMETSPEPVSYNPDDLMEKCTVSGSPSCPMLRDALSQLTSEVRLARDQAADELNTVETDCKRLSEEYERQTQEWETQLEDNSAKLSEQTGVLNTAELDLSEKVTEANELLRQLADFRKDCVKKIKEGAETICGIKSIRQELYQMQSYNPFIEDCEVGAWQPGECSVECGGGEMTMTREVVTPASNGGAECPIMIDKESCNMQPCPIDCVVGEWSDYGMCSAPCGGGIMSRVRQPLTDAEHGGEPCGDLSETQECNVFACDMPCELDPEWTEWSPCSKECDTGITVQTKGVMKAGGPQGQCWEWWEEERMQEAYCNDFPCPSDLVCTAQLDMLVLLDGSGSVNWYGPGFEQERSFTKKLFELMSFGEAGAKAGVILFSWEAELISPMTVDQQALLDAVEGMVWPHWSTDTAAALTMAKTELTNSGRPDVAKENTIVFLLTDGNANSMWSTKKAATDLKEVATLYVVIIGNNVNMNQAKKWPSYPWEEHLIKVEEFDLLESQIETILSDACKDLGCRETMTGNGQDYLGCQYQTNSGYMCQNWLEQSPQSHSYIPEWYPDGHLGDHNFCRNPDGDSTIWCITTNPSVRWEFCSPRTSGSVPEHLMG